LTSSESTSYCKAHPDEKGIETRIKGDHLTLGVVGNCKAHPDEKGIETYIVPHTHLLPVEIAKPIPMKRELKQYHF